MDLSDATDNKRPVPAVTTGPEAPGRGGGEAPQSATNKKQRTLDELLPEHATRAAQLEAVAAVDFFTKPPRVTAAGAAGGDQAAAVPEWLLGMLDRSFNFPTEEVRRLSEEEQRDKVANNVCLEFFRVNTCIF